MPVFTEAGTALYLPPITRSFALAQDEGIAVTLAFSGRFGREELETLVTSKD